MPKLLETFDQLIRSSEIRSTDPLSKRVSRKTNSKVEVEQRGITRLTCSEVQCFFEWISQEETKDAFGIFLHICLINYPEKLLRNNITS